MKSKHIATYGKKITQSNAQSNSGDYHIIDSFRCKSKIIAALPAR